MTQRLFARAGICLLLSCFLLIAVAAQTRGQTAIWNPPHAQSAASTMLNSRLEFDQLRQQLYTVFDRLGTQVLQKYLRETLAAVRERLADSIVYRLKVKLERGGKDIKVTIDPGVIITVEAVDVDINSMLKSFERTVVDSVVPAMIRITLGSVTPSFYVPQLGSAFRDALRTLLLQAGGSGDDKSVVRQWASAIWDTLRNVIVGELEERGVIGPAFRSDPTALTVRMTQANLDTMFAPALNTELLLSYKLVDAVRSNLISIFPGITEDMLAIGAMARCDWPFAIGLPMLDAALAEQKAEGSGSIGLALLSTPNARISLNVQVQTTVDAAEPLPTNGRLGVDLRYRANNWLEIEGTVAGLRASDSWNSEVGIGANACFGQTLIMGVTVFAAIPDTRLSLALNLKAASSASPVLSLGMSKRGSDNFQPLVQILYPFSAGKDTP